MTSPNPEVPGPAPTLAQAVNAPVEGVPGAPNFDHRPISDLLENQLQDHLNTPVQDILNQHGLGQLPHVDPSQLFSGAGGSGLPGQMSGVPGMGGGNDFAGGLLKPATDLLGSVGNGIFQGMNPQQLFSPITQAFSQGASGLQQALGGLFSGAGGGAGNGGGWAGQSAGAAAQSAGQTMAHGAATSAQGAGLSGHFTTAAADSSQGYSDLLETIQQGQDELSALSGGLPWTAGNMVESASRTSARATAIVSQLESTLTANAGATQATGAPVEAASQLPQLMGSMMSVGTSMLSPAMSVGMMPLMMGVQAMQTGLQAGTGLMSSLGKGAGGASAAAGAIPKGLGTLASATHGIGGGAGGGGAAVTPARAVNASPMIQRETNVASTATTMARTVSGGGSAGGMGGGGMMGGAGAAGHGGKAGAGNNHTTASYLHTSDQGGEIVGDLGTASPAVIGESSAVETATDDDPDVKLRI